MQARPVQISDVIYNPASSCFEALVTVHDGDTSRRYACAIDAPIQMSFEDAASGLSKQALRRHAGESGLTSYRLPRKAAPRAGRHAPMIKHWLDPLTALLGKHAA